jgi:hypothetical protein
VARLPAGIAAGLVFAFALFQAIATNHQPDFFIYRLGAGIGLLGVTPYSPRLIRDNVADQFPDPDPGPDSFVNNCGYFLPPMAILVFAPFAMLPWMAAKIAWAIASAGAALAITRVPSLFRRSPPGSPKNMLGMQFVSFLLVVNFLTLSIVQVGQSTMVVVGCVAFGQFCFEKGRPTAGVLLWSIAFIKPHVALPLIPLAWYLGGWKRAAALAGAVAGANLAGALIIGGSPLVIRDYFDFLASGHKAVAFNLVERNPEITSWNRLLFVTTGVLIEQTARTTLAAYLILGGLVVGRWAVTGAKPTAAWSAAATAIGAVWCPQVLAYEVLFLAFAVPWVRELFESGHWLRGIMAALLLTVQLVPFETFAAIGIEFHRPLAVALLAVLVVLGPVSARAAPPTP